jgi:hypothetical protein
MRYIVTDHAVRADTRVLCGVRGCELSAARGLVPEFELASFAPREPVRPPARRGLCERHAAAVERTPHATEFGHLAVTDQDLDRLPEA